MRCENRENRHRVVLVKASPQRAPARRRTTAQTADRHMHVAPSHRGSGGRVTFVANLPARGAHKRGGFRLTQRPGQVLLSASVATVACPHGQPPPHAVQGLSHSVARCHVHWAAAAWRLGHQVGVALRARAPRASAPAAPPLTTPSLQQNPAGMLPLQCAAAQDSRARSTALQGANAMWAAAHLRRRGSQF